jgi:hypothetical protein
VPGDPGPAVWPAVSRDHHEVKPAAVASSRLLVPLPALGADGG